MSRELVDSGFDTLSSLEERIDMLIRLLGEVRADNERLRKELAAEHRTIQELEAQKHSLSTSIGALKAESEGQREKQQTAAERLELLVARLESAG